MPAICKPLRFASGDEASPAIGVAPLVDIVLLLICFYLMVSQTIQQQHDPEVRLPPVRADLAEAPLPAEVVINLRADGAVLMNLQPVTIGELSLHLARERAAAAAEAQPLRVVIRADRRQPYASLSQVLAAVREVGLPHVLLRAEGEDRP